MKLQHSTRIVKKSIQFQTNHADITTYNHQKFCDALFIFHNIFTSFIYGVL